MKDTLVGIKTRHDMSYSYENRIVFANRLMNLNIDYKYPHMYMETSLMTEALLQDQSESLLFSKHC